MEFYLKYYKNNNETLVAICDKEIHGKILKHNDIDIFVNPKFYGDILYGLNDVLHAIKEATSLNIMGKEICNFLLEQNFIHPDTIIWFANGDEKIGHVIVVR